MTVPRTPIGNAPPRANQLNPEDDDEFINVANNQENQQLPINDNTDDASKASTDCTTSPNNSQIIKPRKPPSFSNNAGQNAAVWLRQMQNYLNLANIDSSTWVVYAETYLDNDALQWWVNF